MVKQIDATWYQGEYLNFHDLGPIKPGKVTHRFSVTSRPTDGRTSGVKLGEIKWWTHWRKYTFFPMNSMFDNVCLRDVTEFLEQRTNEIKATWQKK